MTGDSLVAARPMSNGRLGMLLFVASEVMLFTALVAGYVVLGAGSDGFAGLDRPPMGLAPYGLAALVASSLALAVAQRAVARDRSASVWALVALALGAAFLGVQIADWSSLAESGFGPSSAVNTGMVHLAGAVHAVHVAAGLVILAMLAARSRGGGERARTMATVAALYWHFVTIVWVTLFLMLYLL